MATVIQSETCSVESGSAKNRKLYLARLRDNGLPTKRLERKSPPPDQFQIAQLAATIGKSPDGKQSCSDLAAEALQLWIAAGRVLWVKEQLDLICRGIPHFDSSDWWTHAGDLVGAFNDSEGGVPGRLDSDSTKEFVIAGRKAGFAVNEVWEQYSYRIDNHTILKALFPGKSETERSRSEKFLGLLDFIQAFLREETVQRRDYFKKYKTDALTSWIEGPWSPLGFFNDEARDHVIAMTRKELAKPKQFLNPMSLTVFPEVVRWLVVMRIKQVAEKRTRRNFIPIK
jgi:hypothetical protein